MVKWWGEGVTSAHRNSLLAHEILLNAKRIDGKEPKASWFVGEKEVCRNFYLRARGVHHELARTTEKALLSQKTSVQGLVKERRLPKEKENTRGHIIKDWLQSYSKRFAEKSSTDKITVLPFQNIKPIYNEYKEDFQNDVSLRLQKSPLSESQFGKLFNKYSYELGIRVTRDVGTLLSCTVCDAYDARLRAAHSEEQRAILLSFKKRHRTKQEAQRDKYYKHRRKVMENGKKYL